MLGLDGHTAIRTVYHTGNYFLAIGIEVDRTSAATGEIHPAFIRPAGLRSGVLAQPATDGDCPTEGLCSAPARSDAEWCG